MKDLTLLDLALELEEARINNVKHNDLRTELRLVVSEYADSVDREDVTFEEVIDCLIESYECSNGIGLDIIMSDFMGDIEHLEELLDTEESEDEESIVEQLLEKRAFVDKYKPISEFAV